MTPPTRRTVGHSEDSSCRAGFRRSVDNRADINCFLAQPELPEELKAQGQLVIEGAKERGGHQSSREQE